MTKFADLVYEVVRKIPKGETLTYGEVAEMIGHPGAARAVGTVLSKNYDPKIPCHRVVRADGSPGGYNRGTERKAAILKSESIDAGRA